MSDELAEIGTKRGVAVTAFYGGIKRGRCIQLTPTRGGYSQLDQNEVRQLVGTLNEWLSSPTRKDANA